MGELVSECYAVRSSVKPKYFYEPRYRISQPEIGWKFYISVNLRALAADYLSGLLQVVT